MAPSRETDKGCVCLHEADGVHAGGGRSRGATSNRTGTKPEASLPFEAVSFPVADSCSWVPATTRALTDVDELRGLIDEQLLFDARRRLEAQLLAGNGTSPNLRGFDNTTVNGQSSIFLGRGKPRSRCTRTIGRARSAR